MLQDVPRFKLLSGFIIINRHNRQNKSQGSVQNFPYTDKNGHIQNVWTDRRTELKQYTPLPEGPYKNSTMW